MTLTTRLLPWAASAGLLAFVLVGPTWAQAETCPQGKTITTYTDGNCCWPGQGWSGSECVGLPSACPDGMRADGNKCIDGLVVCLEGRRLMLDEQTCCWTGQTLTPQGCYGTPSSCPEGTTAGADGCEKPHHSPTKVPLLPEMEVLCERVTAAGTTLPAEPTAEDIIIRSNAARGYDKLCGLSGGFYTKLHVTVETDGAESSTTREAWYAPPNLEYHRSDDGGTLINGSVIAFVSRDSGLGVGVAGDKRYPPLPWLSSPATDRKYSPPKRTSHEGRDVWLVSSEPTDKDLRGFTYTQYFASETGLPVYSKTRGPRSYPWTNEEDFSGGWNDMGAGILVSRESYTRDQTGRHPATTTRGTVEAFVLEPTDMPSFKLADFLMEHCPSSDPHRSSLIAIAQKIDQAGEEGDEQRLDILMAAMSQRISDAYDVETKTSPCAKK